MLGDGWNCRRNVASLVDYVLNCIAERVTLTAIIHLTLIRINKAYYYTNKISHIDWQIIQKCK